MSAAIQGLNKVSLTKNIALPEQNIQTSIVATNSMDDGKKNGDVIWPGFGYFGLQACDFHLDKENMPENSIFYLNQGYWSYKDNRKIYNGDYYILGQIVEYVNPPENIINYAFKDREVKLYRPRYDQVTGNFQGFYETIGYITVRGDPEEYFFDYGFCKEKSKFLFSYHKKITPSSFGGTFFDRCKISYESKALPADRSSVYFFLPRPLTVSRKLVGTLAQ